MAKNVRYFPRFLHFYLCQVQWHTQMGGLGVQIIIKNIFINSKIIVRNYTKTGKVRSFEYLF